MEFISGKTDEIIPYFGQKGCIFHRLNVSGQTHAFPYDSILIGEQILRNPFAVDIRYFQMSQNCLDD